MCDSAEPDCTLANLEVDERRSINRRRIQMARKKPTPGEALFEEYLKSQNLSDFEYEKEWPGKKKRPDYSVVIADREYLFDVKDFDYVDLPPEGGFDPYKRIRGKIGEARQQVNEFQGW